MPAKKITTRPAYARIIVDLGGKNNKKSCVHWISTILLKNIFISL